jgi:ankyrin repeat protein
MNLFKTKEERLCEAAKKGNYADVISCLRKGANINCIDATVGFTPAHWAANLGHRDVLKLLIDNGADLNAKTKISSTLLHLAADCGHKDVIELLLDLGADVNAKDRLGYTPLIWASSGGHKEASELLIAKGADINFKDDTGMTSLHWAAKKGYKDVTESLIISGGEVNARANKGFTPLHLAAVGGYAAIAQMLIAANSNVNAKDIVGMTPLHWAAAAGYKDVVELLIAMGANMDALTEDGVSPLRLAVEKGQEDIAELLKKKGAQLFLKKQLVIHPKWHDMLNPGFKILDDSQIQRIESLRQRCGANHEVCLLSIMSTPWATEISQRLTLAALKSTYKGLKEKELWTMLLQSRFNVWRSSVESGLEEHEFSPYPSKAQIQKISILESRLTLLINEFRTFEELINFVVCIEEELGNYIFGPDQAGSFNEISSILGRERPSKEIMAWYFSVLSRVQA